MKDIIELISDRPLILDGAMGTELQKLDIPDSVWEGKQGCNELLNITAPHFIKQVHTSYLQAGADILKTNAFGALPWVLDEYGLGEKTYEIALASAKIARECILEFASSASKDPNETLYPDESESESSGAPIVDNCVASAVFGESCLKFVAGAMGPGTKLPSLGHIDFDTMYDGYKLTARALIDGGVDLFLLETCQDPLQIKAALIAIDDVQKELGTSLPVMVSATIEINGSMLIGTDIATLAAILEPYEIISLGMNCGTGPEEAEKHLKALSSVWHRSISIHANAGLPQNRGGCTFYPMDENEFSERMSGFLEYDGVAFLGGCCGTTPKHIEKLVKKVANITPKKPTAQALSHIASLFGATPLKQEIPPLLIGERSNATGSKAFRDILLASDYDKALTVAQDQVGDGAHCLDVSVGFAGRDESKDTLEVMSRYAQKIPLPLMPDSTSPKALEIALKCIGGRSIINSANLEDGLEKFDTVCRLAKTYGTALVCLTIDETGMAKSKERKVDVASRMRERAVNLHGLREKDLIFDLLTFTVGSGDEEYFTAATETIDAIREVSRLFPESGSTLGVSNISFGLDKDARVYLNSVFLYHAVQTGLSSAIVNVKHLLPMANIEDVDREVCEALLFNHTKTSEPLFRFIEHFKSNIQKSESVQTEDSNEPLPMRIKKLLKAGQKEKMLALIEKARAEIAPEVIVNEILIDGMREIGELFGNGKMQLPFVLQSAEVMKATVDYLNPYLPKIDKSTKTTLILGTVKGDVHDVGKNLVDIILTNNGFKVVNIGIKADLDSFITALKEHNAQAIGMSGLLVKSTQVMQENLIEMRKQGINIPILLGGAALNREFIDDFCVPSYDGAIFYCKDAFDGISAMQRVERGEAPQPSNRPKRAKTEEPHLPIEYKIEMPSPATPPHPPFFGRQVWSLTQEEKELAFSWLNLGMLFHQRWGYTKKGLTIDEQKKQMSEVILPEFVRLKKLFLDELFEPVLLYGYFKAKSDGENLKIEDKIFNFPRQKKPPHRCIADFFRADIDDVVALSVVSSGLKLQEYERELYAAHKYHDYYLVHGLGTELAEALAEMVHKRVRIELGIAKDEGESIKDVRMEKYHGCRYSFGYPACPDLELNEPLFSLLRPQEFGVELSETFQIVPECSTSALIVHHKEADYFGI